MAVALLALANVALFVLQLALYAALTRPLRRVSRRHDTLVSPAPRLAVSSWAAVQLLLSLVVIGDVVAPVSSLFAAAPHPDLLRLLLSSTLACNSLWIWSRANDWVYLSTLGVSLQWLTLWTLYLFLVFVARVQHYPDDAHPFSLRAYLITELGLVAYTAWTTYVMVENVAMAMQKFFESCLSFASYASLLCVLSLVVNWTVVFYQDCAFGLCGVWILVVVSAKSSAWESPTIERLHDSVQESAVQLAVIGATILTILLSLMVSRNEQTTN